VPPPGDEPGGCEDGFLFLGQRGKGRRDEDGDGDGDGDGDVGVHLLCHCNGVQGYPWDDHGRHAFSVDGIEWEWSQARTFTPTFTHPDGTNTSHISRQRPQIVFGREGNVPTHLITGISVSSTNRPYPWQAGCSQLVSVAEGCDLTSTSIQPVLA
jgi:hypothetical protein